VGTGIPYDSREGVDVIFVESPLVPFATDENLQRERADRSLDPHVALSGPLGLAVGREGIMRYLRTRICAGNKTRDGLFEFPPRG
jgi:hypothetical protein